VRSITSNDSTDCHSQVSGFLLKHRRFSIVVTVGDGDHMSAYVIFYSIGFLSFQTHFKSS